jgi:prepilin-type processing-associated H-X9-DG protein
MVRRQAMLLLGAVVLAGVAATALHADGARRNVVMCDGHAATILATAPLPAVTNGTSHADVIAPAPGVVGVEILGKGGDDRICGSDAHDVLVGGHGQDRIFGLGGPDCILGDDAVFADSCQANFLEVTGGADHLEGGPGDDEIHGQIGKDTELGGPGDDTMTGDDGGDTLKGQNGDDTISGGSGKDTLNGGAGNDTLDGGSGRDTCHGGSGVNHLISC